MSRINEALMGYKTLFNHLVKQYFDTSRAEDL
jgi:hypothetical protein